MRGKIGLGLIKHDVLDIELQQILCSLDDFGWIGFIDDLGEFASVLHELNYQRGVVDCLHNLHLISNDDYVKQCKIIDSAFDALRVAVADFGKNI